MKNVQKGLVLALAPALALAALIAMPALADDAATEAPMGAEGPDMAAMMEAMQKAGAPGENHAFLAKMAGDWTFVNTMWMDPSQPPMKSEGTTHATMLYDGRFLQEELKGDMMGMSFDGRGLTGYDNTAGKFVGTWIDSSSTSIMVVDGERDGNTLTMHGEYLDPASKQMHQVRYVLEAVDDDHHTFSYFTTVPDGPEIKSMEIAYTRKAAM